MDPAQRLATPPRYAPCLCRSDRCSSSPKEQLLRRLASRGAPWPENSTVIPCCLRCRPVLECPSGECLGALRRLFALVRPHRSPCRSSTLPMWQHHPCETLS